MSRLNCAFRSLNVNMTETARSIRVLALAVLRRADGRILVEKGEDTKKGEVFYRPLGGGVEFGERGEDALKREFREELGKEIVVRGFLQAVENIFVWEGRPGHEVILFFDCAFADAADEKASHHPHLEGEKAGQTYWRTIDDIKAEGAVLHPNQLVAMLG